MRARFFDRQAREIIRNSKHRAPFLAELVPDTGTTLLIGLGSNGGCAQLLHFLKLGKSTRLERGRKSKLRVVVVQDRKSTRLNSSHEWISYAVFCLKKKNNNRANRKTHCKQT